MSKATAILGGQMSALDRIRAAQQGLVSPPVQNGFQVAALPSEAGRSDKGLVPGIGGDCNRFSLPKVTVPTGTGSRGGDDFLLTRRLPVSRTAFDAEWSRVSAASLSASSVRQFLPSALRTGRASLATLQRVNAWANHRIRYVEDAKLFGRADYWADAATTLRTKAGDCEDIAIAKLQVLAGMGVPRSDMYLTIARDLVRHADHALLVVRMDGRYWVLDNATDRLLDANEQLDYQPVLSFNSNRKWLHGAVSLAVN